MRNPFKKQDQLDIDTLIFMLMDEIDILIDKIKDIREDLEDLTDFVEERLD